MRDADRRRMAIAVPLLASLAAAALLAGSSDAGAAPPVGAFEPGATCTRSRCAPDATGGGSRLIGFAASALAAVGLGRRRTASAGPPRA